MTSWNGPGFPRPVSFLARVCATGAARNIPRCGIEVYPSTCPRLEFQSFLILPFTGFPSKGIVMKLKLVTLALAFAAVPAHAAMGTTDIPTFAGQAAAQAAAKTATPKTPEEWLARMTDFSRNASAFKDPKVFVPWANAVTEPGFYIAMMNGMMDPGGWLNMMNSMAHPDAVRNMVQFTDPAILLRWSAAGLDPNFYTALLTQLTDPAKMMRWMMAPMDLKNYQPVFNAMNPALYTKWMTASMDVNNYQAALKLADVNTYNQYATVAADPKTYGTWGQMLNAPAQLAAPALPAAASQPPAANPFDPSALLKLIPAPAPQATGK